MPCLQVLQTASFSKGQSGGKGLSWNFLKSKIKAGGCFLLGCLFAGFFNLNFTMLPQGPKYNSPAEKQGLADASFGCFGKFRASLGFATEILQGLEKILLHPCP